MKLKRYWNLKKDTITIEKFEETLNPFYDSTKSYRGKIRREVIIEKVE